MEEKSKIAAGLFALFFGSLGVHKFYLGYTRDGVITLLVTIIGGILTVGIAPFVMGMIGLIEGILYLTKSDEDFKNTYVINKRPWF
ncbi:MAG: TM2 domain-containing protein [Ruminococcus sp.]|nr:TM2 domain-containing protein [Ruminococcus sp.]